jgi:hypothetical protein
MLPLLSCGGGSDQLGVPQLVNLVVTNGVVTGVPDVVDVRINARVQLTVLSDTAAVLLVRGYDVRVQLTVGQPAQVS